MKDEREENPRVRCVWGVGEYDSAPHKHLKEKTVANDIKITVAERAGRQTASSGSKWEPIMGYSRAVRSGNVIAVTGSVGINADGTYPKTLGEQTRRSLQIILAAVEARGGGPSRSSGRGCSSRT